jgi:cell wall-associated NlpC family hydrolase
MRHSVPYYLDLIGRPYERGGRGPDSYDCWGLVRALLVRLGYRNLPDEPTPRAPAAAAEAFQRHGQAWKKQDSRPGAVVLLKDEHGIGSHLGLMIDRGRFIHVSEVRGQVCIDRLSDPLWGGRVMGFYAPNCEDAVA